MNTIWLDLAGAETRYRGTYRTRCIEYGSGTPLILIHGVGGHAEAYSRNVKTLGQSHHAIAIDLAWHGFSGKPPFTSHMVPEYCKQIIDLLDSMGEAKCSIEGESLGGWVAMWFALHYPDRLDKLVLNTTAGIKVDESTVKIDHVGGNTALRERSIAAIQNPNRETIRKRLEWLMASPDRVTEELVDLRYMIYSNPETQQSLSNVFAHSFLDSAAPYAIPESDVAKITAPTLVLWTDKNPGSGPDVGQRIAKIIPGAQYACVDDAAHWPQWEQPEKHDAIVNGFLAGKLAAV